MSRQQQHRPTRETAEKERAQLSQENRALRRKISRLQRQLQEQVENEAPEEDVSLAVAEGNPEVMGSCIKCGSIKIGRLVVPQKGTLHVCKDCGDRSWTT